VRIIFDKATVLAPPFRLIERPVRLFCSLTASESKLRALIMVDVLLCADIIASGKLSDDIANETLLETSIENQEHLTCRVDNGPKLAATITIKKCE